MYGASLTVATKSGLFVDLDADVFRVLRLAADDQEAGRAEIGLGGDDCANPGVAGTLVRGVGGALGAAQLARDLLNLGVLVDRLGVRDADVVELAVGGRVAVNELDLCLGPSSPRRGPSYMYALHSTCRLLNEVLEPAALFASSCARPCPLREACKQGKQGYNAHE